MSTDIEEIKQALADGKHVIILDDKPIETESYGDEGDGVIVWFADDEAEYSNAAASAFRKSIDAVVYG